jgi:hypothetical protein
MNVHTSLSCVSLCLSALALPSLAIAADSAYVPRVGGVDTSLTISRSSYDNFYLGDVKVSNQDAFGSNEKVYQGTASLAVRYGVNARTALDVTVGYTSVDFKPLDIKEKGLDDTRLGVTTVLADEFDDALAKYNLPTVSMRIGVIIKGTYNTGESVAGPTAPGLGANGAEASLLFGKYFASIGFGLTASAGFRYYAEEVPGRLLWSAGAYQVIADQVVVSGQVQASRSGTGPDIGGPGFTGDFRAVREEKAESEIAVAYTGIADSQFGIFGAKTLASGNRNVGDATTYGLFLGHQF